MKRNELKEFSVNILVLHCVLFVIQFLFMVVFPGMKKAAIGIYLVLMPVGYLFFADPDPLVVAGSVILGLAWVFFWGQRETRSSSKQVAVSEAGA